MAKTTFVRGFQSLLLKKANRKPAQHLSGSAGIILLYVLLQSTTFDAKRKNLLVFLKKHIFSNKLIKLGILCYKTKTNKTRRNDFLIVSDVVQFYHK